MNPGSAKTSAIGWWKSAIFSGACFAASALCIVILVVLLGAIVYQGWEYLDWQLLTSEPSRKPAEAGVRTALLGSIWVMFFTTLISVPIGVGSAIYLEEYAAASRWRTVFQSNIANLAGVPSIVYGILGLILFVRGWKIPGTELEISLGHSVLAGAATLSLVILPIIILAAQEALRAVPPSLRSGSMALGATKWQTICHQVLPAAVPGIMTGVILALSRALGEAAPLIAIGVVALVPYSPTSPMDEFTAMPIQIFDWSGRPQAEFHKVAAAAILVLLAVLILLNALAVIIRYRFSKRVQW